MIQKLGQIPPKYPIGGIILPPIASQDDIAPGSTSMSSYKIKNLTKISAAIRKSDGLQVGTSLLINPRL